MTSTVDIRVTATDATRPGFASVNRSMSTLKTAALSLSPALIPVGASLGPIAASAAAAGVAMGAFGAAIIPQILALSEAAKAETKYTEAVEAQGKSSEAAAKAEQAYLQQVKSLPPATREAAAAFSHLRGEYKDWAESLSDSTMPVATKSFAVFGGLFPKLTPVVRTASAELNRFLTIVGGGIQSSAFDRFMTQFNTFTAETLAKANSGVMRLVASLDSGEASGGLAEFMRYARENGPLVGETLRNLAEAIGRILAAASETGVGLLSVVNAFAQLINAVPPDLLSSLVQVAVAFKAIQLAAFGVATVGPMLMSAAAGATAFTRAARFGGVSTAIEGVAQRMTLLQRSTVVLAVLTAIVLGINHLAEEAKGAPPDVDALTDSLKRLGEAGKFTGELKATFGDMDGFVNRVQAMRGATEMLDKSKPFVSLIPLGGLAEKAAAKLDQLINGTKSLTALKEDVGAFDESFASLARSGHADEAATQFRRFEEALKASGMSAQEVAAAFPQYQAAVASLKAEQELAARSMGLFGAQAVEVQSKLDAQKASADGLRQSIQALNDVNRQALGGMIGFEAAIDAAAKAAQENAGSLNMVNGSLDLNGEKARSAASALQDLASKTDEAAAAARGNGESWSTVSGIYERGRQQLIANARQMGLTRAEAAQLAEQILKTPDKTAVLRGNMEDLQAKLNTAKAQLASVPDSRRAEVRANIADLQAKVDQAQRELASLRDRTVFVRTHYQNFTSQHPGGQAQAHGGIIGAAGGGPRSRMTLVGEQGPELVDLAPGSRVRSNPDSKRIADGMAGGGGGTTVLEIRSSGSRVDDLLLEILRGAIRVKGGDAQLVLGSRNR